MAFFVTSEEIPATEQSPGETLLNPLMPLALVNPVIVSAVNTYDGKLTNANVAAAHGYEYTDL